MQVRGPILPTQPEGVNPGLATPVLLRTPDTGRLVGDELKARREEDKAKRSAQTRGLGNLDVKPIKADPTLSSALNNTMASIVTDVTNRVASDPAYGDALRFIGDGFAPGFKNPESRQRFEAAVADIRSVQAAYGILSNLGQQSIKIRENVKSLYDDDTNSVITADINKFLRPDAVIEAVRNRDFETADSLVANIDPTTFVAKRKNLVQEVNEAGGFQVLKNSIFRTYAPGNTAAQQRWERDSTKPDEEIKKLKVGYVNPKTGVQYDAESPTDLLVMDFLRGKKASTYGFTEDAEGYDNLYDAARRLYVLKENREELAFPPQAIIQQNQQLSTGDGVPTFVTKYVGASKDDASLDNPRNYVSNSALAFQVNPIGGKYPPISLPATDPNLVFQYGTSPYDAARMLRAPVPSSIDGRILRILVLNDPGSPTGYREVFEVRTTPASEVRQDVGVSGLDVDVETATPTSGGEIVYVDVRANPTLHTEFLARMSQANLAQRNNFILEAERFRKAESDRELRETNKAGAGTPGTPGPKKLGSKWGSPSN